MNVAVRKQTDEVHGAAVLNTVRGKVFPSFGGEHLSAFDALVYELSALRVDLAAAESIVTYLGVAHIIIAGQTNGIAVSLERSIGVLFQQHI